MSGHNKWSQIKHRKGAQDLKKSKTFSKINKEIAVAVKSAGANPDNNFRLRAAIDWAKEENMSVEIVNRAIQKASGNEDKSEYEELTYEGFGPGGVALIVECLSDNKNRTISNIRTVFNKGGGQIGASVQHLFDRQINIKVNCQADAVDKLLEVALTAGALDIVQENDVQIIVCELTDFKKLNSALTGAGFKIEKADIAYNPKEKIEIADKNLAKEILDLINAIEDDDDVLHLFTNFEIAEDLIEALSTV